MQSFSRYLPILPDNFEIAHVKGHQDDYKLEQDLITEENLNIEADKIVTTCVKLPINIHLLTAPFIVYIKGEYIHLSSHKVIREVSFKDSTKQFIK